MPRNLKNEGGIGFWGLKSIVHEKLKKQCTNMTLSCIGQHARRTLDVIVDLGVEITEHLSLIGHSQESYCCDHGATHLDYREV